MERKLDIWKNRLLDLGRRNKLLNYRDVRQANLRIEAPDLFALWEDFVRRERPLAFSAGGDGSVNSAVHSAQQAVNAVTNLAPEEQQRTLRNLRGRAKSFVEEQGVNALFLSFGFLRWTDSAAAQSCDAPLILVPVALSLESITAPYVLSLHEDEIVTNPTLLYKLERDFGIHLPEFSPGDTPAQYFEAISECVRERNWEVVPEVGLGMLPFLKINLYRDLERHRTALLENPVVRAIGGDAAALEDKLSESDVSVYDRTVRPDQVFQVVDADSSQQEALLFARQGHSFVLQGPPGTGKSQTITNLIAECLADGKKVLFVSEKMAALEVVHRRLTEVGLADFCLILHSWRASKKETLDQLGSVLRLAQGTADSLDVDDQIFDRLAERRDLLNDCADAMFTVVEPLHRTMYEVSGRLAELRNVPDVSFSMSGVRETDRETYRNYQTALRHLADHLETVGGCMLDHPWRGCTIQKADNTLRTDAIMHINTLIPAVTALDTLCKDLSQSLNLDFPHTCAGAQEMVALLDAAAKSPLVPASWILTENLSLILEQVSVYRGNAEDLRAQRGAVHAFQDQLAAHQNAADILKFRSLSTLSEIDGLRDAVCKVLQEEPCYAAWDHLEDWNRVTDLYENLKVQLQIYQDRSGALLEEFQDGIFEVDADALYSILSEKQNSPFRILNAKYRAARKQLCALRRTGGKQTADKQFLAALEQLRERNEVRAWFRRNDALLQETLPEIYQVERTSLPQLEARMETYQTLKRLLEELSSLRTMACAMEEDTAFQQQCGSRYTGLDTDWESLTDALHWAESFKTLLGTAGKNAEFARAVCTKEEAAQACAVCRDRLRDSLSDLEPDLTWFLGLFEASEQLPDLLLLDLLDRLEACWAGLPDLEKWLDCQAAVDECRALGLEEYIQQIGTCSIESDEIIPVFEKRFYRLWLDQVSLEFPAAAQFRYSTQGSAAAEFAQLDRMQLAIARDRIRARLIERLPTADRFTGGAEDAIGLLKQELGKRRRVKPLRRLFREIPDLILALKPCMMMSPLSVSMYLESGSFQFDTVIFDEASQIRTEDALGAILRGRQVIIAGDRNQLPPTNFFLPAGGFDGAQRTAQEDEIHFDSILEEAALLPERTLLWHYRSRHESLIDFSNQNIYHGSLLTFPSPVERAPDLGVEYTYIPNGVYDRGGRKGNLPEARKVAQMVFEHFRNHPDRSLGVIAFGEIQQTAIDTALRELRLKNQRFESFFDEERTDAFFVKSLENVQGDERDTIIFSIGYARDLNGVLHMHFGPLSKDGGERRLNVGITRAKYNLKLVGSILPSDIDVNRVSAEGPRLLRDYIAFAMRNSAAVPAAPERREIWQVSAFEKSICDFLQERGYQTDVQIGCSNCRVDIGVRSPAREGRYVLGILCDGASYHAARTTRERDRLRQDVLESFGWRIYRAWSVDWVKDAAAAERQLAAAVEAALADEAAEAAVEAETAALVAVEAAEAAMEAEVAALAADVPDMGAQAPSTADLPTAAEVSAELAEEAPCEPETEFRFDTPHEMDLAALPAEERERLGLNGCILRVVETEYPVHTSILSQRLLPAMGWGKSTPAIRKQIDAAIADMASQILRRGGFLYPVNCSQIPARPANGRTIQQISDDELAVGMYRTARRHPGLSREELFNETTHAFGFSRQGTKITAALERAHNLLLEHNAL